MIRSPGRGIPPDKDAGLLRADGIGNVLRSGRLACPLAVGGGDDAAVGTDELKLQLVLVLEGLGKLDAGLIIFVVALADIISKEIRRRPGLAFKAGAHVGIIICSL